VCAMARHASGCQPERSAQSVSIVSVWAVKPESLTFVSYFSSEQSLTYRPRVSASHCGT
jgi:hypothetical protein